MMKFVGVIFLVLYNILQIENRMLPYNYLTANVTEDEKSSDRWETHSMDSAENEKVVSLKSNEDRDEVDETDNGKKQDSKKPCAIVVLSSIQNPSMQTLLRRYRYDSKGVLIPSSVKYFMKLPQGLRSSPILTPLNDKAFSPLGGFVRYYKEVPPIPHSF